MKLYRFAPMVFAAFLAGCSGQKPVQQTGQGKPAQAGEAGYQASGILAKTEYGLNEDIFKGTMSEKLLLPAYAMLYPAEGMLKSMTPEQSMKYQACAASFFATAIDFATQVREANPDIKNAKSIKTGTPVKIPKMPIGNGYAPEATINTGLGGVAREVSTRAMLYNEFVGCSKAGVPGLYPLTNTVSTIVGNDAELLDRAGVELKKFRPNK